MLESSSAAPQLTMLSKVTKQRVLKLWFQDLHGKVFDDSQGQFRGSFQDSFLFEDDYLLQVLACCLPEEFEIGASLRRSSTAGSEDRRPGYHRRTQSTIELSLFNQLKVFYNRRNYDLAEVLKAIRNKKQHFSKFAGDSYQLENTYWSLLCIVFTTLFIAREHSPILRVSFEELMSPNSMEPQEFEVFKMALDIISSVLRRTALVEEEPVIRHAVTEPTQPAFNSLESEGSEERWGAAGETGQPVGKGRRQVPGAMVITESSEDFSGDEDDLLKEDQEQWDIFDDWQKFQQRDEILRNKRRQQAAEEKKNVQAQIE